MNNACNKISQKEKENIVKEYNNGISINAIIKKYNHKYKTIAKILDEFNVQHYKGNKTHCHGARVVLTEEEKQTIIGLYNKGWGLQACARAVGHNDIGLIRKVLDEVNIPRRNFSEAASISNKNRRKYKVNEHYFSQESRNMAYIMGFIAADGTISKRDNRIKIGLSIVDYVFLEKIRAELEAEKSIKTYTNSNGYECCTLEFVSEQMKKDLAFYNIVPAKTFVFKFPTHLEKKYWIDFIRGYFDGDGSVSTAGPKAIKWQVCSATIDILQHIVDFFYEEYGIPKVNIRQEKREKHILYNICYSTNSTKRIHEILYTKDSLYLDRKKEKFDKLISK